MDLAFVELENRFTDDVAIVIGNGPSLRKVPSDFLAKYKTFGTNRIHLRGIVPDFYVVVNPLVFDQDSTGILTAGSEYLFLPDSFEISGTNIVPIRITNDEIFGNPFTGFYEGWTVTYVCLQLAYFFGFRTVLLVGVDHKYETDAPGGTILEGRSPDPDHFDPDYFGEGWKWHAPDLRKSEKAYRLALLKYEAAGRRIVNLTEGTALNVFEVDLLENWI